MISGNTEFFVIYVGHSLWNIFFLFILNPADEEQEICSIHPPNGESLSTEFHIKCEEELINERDIPLTYIWTYRRRSNETWKSITYPSDGEFVLVVFKRFESKYFVIAF